MKWHSVKVEPAFNEVDGDWENLFVKWRFRCIENVINCNKIEQKQVNFVILWYTLIMKKYIASA